MTVAPRAGIEPDKSYWRIQQAGQQLSRSHRSTIGHEEDNLGFERATSATASFSALAQWAQGGHGNWLGPVDIVQFRGSCVGRGSDGEPVVVPIKEVARYRIVGGREEGQRVSDQLRGARAIGDVPAQRVPTEKVIISIEKQNPASTGAEARRAKAEIGRWAKKGERAKRRETISQKRRGVRWVTS